MEVGFEGCLDMLMLCACCLLLCTLKHTHTHTHTHTRTHARTFSTIVVLFTTPKLNSLGARTDHTTSYQWRMLMVVDSTANTWANRSALADSSVSDMKTFQHTTVALYFIFSFIRHIRQTVSSFIRGNKIYLLTRISIYLAFFKPGLGHCLYILTRLIVENLGIGPTCYVF